MGMAIDVLVRQVAEVAMALRERRFLQIRSKDAKCSRRGSRPNAAKR